MTFWVGLLVYLLCAALTFAVLALWSKQTPDDALGLCLIWPAVWLVWVIFLVFGRRL